MARTMVSKTNIMMLALAAWVVNHPRETRVLVVTVALAAMMIFAFSSPEIAQAGPATGGSVCPAC